MERLFLIAGSLLGLTAVAAGAFGAHLLEARLTAERLSAFHTAANYQMYHALALLGAAWAVTRWDHGAVNAAGWLFLIGAILFSGSIYLLVLGGPRWLGPVTPLGGLTLMAGWLSLAWGIWRG